MDDVLAKLTEWGIIDGAMRVVLALLIFCVGRLVARLVRRIVERLLEKAKQEHALVRFVGNLVYFALLAFIIIAALSKLGIQTASFIAVLGAAGLAVGLALQGSLANFAAGVLLVIFRPFKVGDYVEAAGKAGVVEDIEIFTTTLLTVDNKKVVVPNAKLCADNITNYTAMDTRRVDLVIGVSYDADLKQTRQCIAEVLGADERILKDPPPRRSS